MRWEDKVRNEEVVERSNAQECKKKEDYWAVTLDEGRLLKAVGYLVNGNWREEERKGEVQNGIFS